jgi:hypothetical protein
MAVSSFILLGPPFRNYLYAGGDFFLADHAALRCKQRPHGYSSMSCKALMSLHVIACPEGANRKKLLRVPETADLPLRSIYPPEWRSRLACSQFFSIVFDFLKQGRTVCVGYA